MYIYVKIEQRMDFRAHTNTWKTIVLCHNKQGDIFTLFTSYKSKRSKDWH